MWMSCASSSSNAGFHHMNTCIPKVCGSDIELGNSLPDFSPAILQEFQRMKKDEENHCLVFETIARALGPDDRLAPGETEAALADRL